MIKRAGLVFIVYPIWILLLLFHIILAVTCIIWGPIYYIITGKDPIEEDLVDRFLCIGEDFYNWYIDKFDPNEQKVQFI